MCGIYGFQNADIRPLNVHYLAYVIERTEARGRDAAGYAMITKRNKIIIHKNLGKLSAQRNYKKHLQRMSKAKALVGHCRLSTHGTEKDMKNNHPHRCAAGLYVHNGIVDNHRELDEQFRLERRTDCDTETIGRLIDSMGKRDLGLSVAMAFEYMFGYGNAIALLARTKIVLARHGNPIHYALDKDCMVFASEAIAIPEDKVYPMTDDMVIVFAIQSNRTVKAVDYHRIDAALSDAYWFGAAYTGIGYDRKGKRLYGGKRSAPITAETLDEFDLYNMGWSAYVEAHQGKD